jgi:NitT/TauT family transport system ATP-binding protein
MMAARPGHIMREFKIEEPYPRKTDFMVTQRFMQQAQALQQSLEQASHSEEDLVP